MSKTSVFRRVIFVGPANSGNWVDTWQDVIAFTYRRNGELVGCKYRDENKKFWQVVIKKTLFLYKSLSSSCFVIINYYLY